MEFCELQLQKGSNSEVHINNKLFQNLITNHNKQTIIEQPKRNHIHIYFAKVANTMPFTNIVYLMSIKTKKL